MIRLEKQGTRGCQLTLCRHFFSALRDWLLQTTSKSRLCLLVRPILWGLLGLDELHQQMGVEHMGLQLSKFYGLLSIGPLLTGHYDAAQNGQDHR